MDYSRHTLKIAEGDKKIVDNLTDWQPIPFEETSAGYIVRLRGKDKIYRMLLDTGASGSLVKFSAVENTSIIEECDYDLGSGYPCRSIKLLLPTSGHINPPLIDLPEKFEPDGLLGTDFLEKTSVLIDVKNRLFFLKPENS